MTNVPYCLKNMLSIYSNKKTTHSNPALPPMIMVWTSLNSHSLRSKYSLKINLPCKVDTTHPWVTGFLLLRKKEITIIYSYKRNIFLTFTYIYENLPNILQFIFGYKISFEMLKTFNLKAKQWNAKCVTIGLEKNWHINIFATLKY